MITKIILSVIVLHLIAGFGFILWKIAGPLNEDKQDGDSTNSNSKK